MIVAALIVCAAGWLSIADPGLQLDVGNDVAATPSESEAAGGGWLIALLARTSGDSG